MTSPQEQVVALTEQAAYWADEADLLDAAYLHNAALAASDQAEAFDRDARQVAMASGDPELMRIWQ